MKPNFNIAEIDTKNAAKSILKIFQVPFTSAMSDTMIFKSLTAQENWFKEQYQKSVYTGTADDCCAFTFTQMRPFRIGEPFRVKIKWAEANRCSYFSYYDAESNKTFYGFITGCYWINRNLTEITYSIDPIQSYMFEAIIDSTISTGNNCRLQSCMVERECPSSDKYFENILSEDIVPYDSKCYKVINLFSELNGGDPSPTYYVIQAKYYLQNENTWDNLAEYDPIMRDVGYTKDGSVLYVVHKDELEPMIRSIMIGVSSEGSSNNPENITSISPIPSRFVMENPNKPDYKVYGYDYILKSGFTPVQLQISIPSRNVKNNKCYNQAFCPIKIMNLNDATMLPSDTLQQGNNSLTISLYVYVAPSISGGILISDKKINNWSVTNIPVEKGINLLYNVSSLPSIGLSYSSYIEYEGMKRDIIRDSVRNITGLVPDLTTMTLMNMGKSSDYEKNLKKYNDMLREQEFMKQQRKKERKELRNEGNIDNISQGKIDYQNKKAELENSINFQKMKVDEAAEASNRYFSEMLPNVAITTGAKVINTIGSALDSMANSAESLLKQPATTITAQGIMSTWNLSWPIFLIMMPTNKALTLIDNFFNMFGYATYEYKKPNLFNRKCWDYIKLNDSKCDPWSKCPNDVKLAIEQIFDKGIRLHHGKYYEDLTITNDIA